MDLYYNGQFITKIAYTPIWTIAGIKNSLNAFLRGKGLTKYTNAIDYTVRFIFNDGIELSPEIFQTNTYDQVNLQNYNGKIEGGKLIVTGDQPIQKPVPVQAPKEEHALDYVYIIVNTEDPYDVHVYRSEKDAFKYYIENHTDIDTIDELLDLLERDIQAIRRLNQDDDYVYVERRRLL